MPTPCWFWTRPALSRKAPSRSGCSGSTRARRDAAGVPENTGFATKPQLGRQMLARAFAAGVPWRWVTGDSVYGADYALRCSIEKSGRGYVLAVTSRQRLGFKTVADWLQNVAASGWAR